MIWVDRVANEIIKEQELIIGPIAWEEAQKVPGIIIDKTRHSIGLRSDKSKTVDNLVKQYGRLFGRASEEVCREAAKDLLVKLPPGEIPFSLKERK